MTLLLPNRLRGRMVDMVQPINRLHPLARDLVALWKTPDGAQGGSRLMDLCDPGPNGNYGTLIHMDPATDWVPTEMGWALEFAPPAYLNIPHIAALDGLSALSVSLWVCPTTLSNLDYIIGQADATDGWWIQTHHLTSGRLYFGVMNAAAKYNVTDDVVVANGVRTHLSMVFDGGLTGDTNRLKLYVNGQSVAISAAAAGTPATIGTCTEPLNFARRSTDNDRFYTGQIGPTAIHSRALLLQEIQQLYLDSLNDPVSIGGLINLLPQRVFASAVAGDITVNPSPVVATWAVVAPTITKSVSPAATASAWSTTTPAVTKTATPAPVLSTWSILGPTIAKAIAPAPAASAWSTTTPTTTKTASPAPIASDWSAVAPTLTKTASPAPIPSAWSAVAPTVARVVAPAPAASDWSVVAPGAVEKTCLPSPASSTWSVVAPTIVLPYTVGPYRFTHVHIHQPGLSLSHVHQPGLALSHIHQPGFTRTHVIP